MYKLVKIFSVIAIVFVLLIMTLPVEAAKKNVAVIPINNNSDTVQTSSESIIYKLVAENMANQLVNVFHSNEGYAVIDREKVNVALTETGIKIGEVIEQDQAIAISKKLNAQCSVIGKIISAEVIENREKRTFEAIKNITDQKSEGSENSDINETTQYTNNVQSEDFEGKITVELKFLNNENGEVIFSDEISSSQGGKTGAIALRAACKMAAEDFLSKIVKQTSIETETETKSEIEQQSPTEEVQSLDISVIYVEDDILYIDKGKDANLKVGDIFVIFKKGVPITDMNGKVITVRTMEVGKALVTEVNNNHSICKIIDRDNSEANAIKRGCTAKKTDE